MSAVVRTTAPGSHCPSGSISRYHIDAVSIALFTSVTRRLLARDRPIRQRVVSGRTSGRSCPHPSPARAPNSSHLGRAYHSGTRRPRRQADHPPRCRVVALGNRARENAAARLAPYCNRPKPSSRTAQVSCRSSPQRTTRNGLCEPRARFAITPHSGPSISRRRCICGRCGRPSPSNELRRAGAVCRRVFPARAPRLRAKRTRRD